MLLVDTSVFISALTDKDVERMLTEASEKAFIISSEVIEKEIRLASDFLQRKGRKEEAEKLRDLYSNTISGTIKFTKRVRALADKYSIEVKDRISKARSQEMADDFRIVSSAAIGSIKTIATFNRRTMANPDIVVIYNEVNSKNNLKTPMFIKTKEELAKFLASA